jgi:hypothetical protein
MKHRNYCTLFDQRYMQKGLALYESLVKHSSEPFTLHVLAMDDATERILNELALPNMHVMTLAGFERAMNLDKIRERRSWAEYCWGCASNLMEYMLPWMDADGITYIDSDIMFFSDPKVIFYEVGARSIGITPHRFSPKEELRLGKNGKFNVGIVVARNGEAGRKCIARWAAQCRDRCSSEVGCGDQQYLDEWPSLYGAECCSIENPGVNLGPWSLDHIDVSSIDLVAYHFHEFVDHKYMTGYALQQIHLDVIYWPYIAALRAASDMIIETENKLAERAAEAEKQWETA